MNKDQVVNGLDIDPFVAAVVGGSAQEIPEPGSLVLTAFGIIAILAHVCERRTRP